MIIFFSQKFLLLLTKQNTKLLKQPFYKKPVLSARQNIKLFKQPTYRKTFLYTWQIILLSFCLNPLASFSDANCQKLFSDPQSFNKAMTQNLILHPQQENLFEFYKNNSFINSLLSLNKNLKDVIKVLEKHPEINKTPIREYSIHVPQSLDKLTQPSFNQLQQFIKSLSQSANRVKNNLFKIKDNIGYWKTLLDFPKLDKEDLKNNLKKQEHNSEFLEYLNTLIKQKEFDFLKNSSSSDKEKSFLIYEILNRARKTNLQKNKDIKRISQAMADIIHIVGFNSEYNKLRLKHKDPLKQIEALYKINEERDSLAQELGFKDFLDLQSKLGVSHPTGLSKNQDILFHLSLLEKEINTQEDDSPIEKLRVRPLSLQEAPFRSCLSGDCASQTYFEKAFDPNFHYFTLTNENHISSGHITVVLGYAEKNKKSIQTAFVDKIQNIPEDRILAMLESIRLSLKEEGYIIGIPVETKGGNALSNTATVSEYISNEINPQLKDSLKNFIPHENNYNFKKGYTRAYDKLDLLEFKLPHNIKHIEIIKGTKREPTLAPKDLSLQILVENILKLQNSKNEQDQIKFINNLSILYKIEDEGISFDFIKNYLYNKIKDKNLSLKLRKFALLYWFEFLEKHSRLFTYKDVLKLLKHFSKQEEKVILGEISNWKKSSNIYKTSFIHSLTVSFFLKITDIKEFSHSKLKNVFNIHAINRFNQSVLNTILSQREIKKAQILLQLGANINSKDTLSSALINKEIQIIKWLIKNGADVNAKNNYGDTALITAIEKNNTTALKLLLNKGADINLKGSFGETALITAIEKNNTTALKLLLNKGADINLKGSFGETALINAIKNNNIIALEILLKNDKTDVNAKNSYGDTALITAIEKNNTTALKLLLNKGADINLKGSFGETALINAIKNNNIIALEILLKNDKTDVNAKNSYGHTALITAIEKNNTTALKLLLNKGADINLKGSFGETALITAIEKNNTTALKLLLNKGADINLKGSFGETALINAIKNNNIIALEILLKNDKTDVNAKNSYGDTALITAIEKNNTIAVKLLLENGANPNIKNKSHHTALWYAKRYNYTEILLLLKKYGAKKWILNLLS